jgi:hypothetical protein
MTLEEVCEYYGTMCCAATAIGVSRQIAYRWNKLGAIPYDKQKRFEQDSKGKLKASNKSHLDIIKNQEILHFPMYRFWSDKLGMCKVKSLIFKPRFNTKIIFYKDDVNKTFTSFDKKCLMQGSSIKDINGSFLYENDIVVFHNHEIYDENTQITFKNLDQIYSENNVSDGIEGNFSIIGNSFEGVHSETSQDV